MFKRSKDRRGMFQLPLPLSFTTVGMLFNMHMHTRRSVYEYLFDFMAKYVYAPYRRFCATRHVFRQIGHKTWRG